MTALTRRRFLTIAAALCVAGPVREAGALTRVRFRAMGAEAEIALPGDPDEAQAAAAECQTLVAHVERTASLWDPESELCRLDRSGYLQAPSPEFRALWTAARRMAELTDGGFDPTVQPIWQALAEGGDPLAARSLVDWQRFSISPMHGARFARPGMGITLNGIAQGFATDLVANLLRQRGYRRLLVNVGEWRGAAGPGGRPWRLGIAGPGSPNILGEISFREGAVATSSPRATLVGGDAHIFDPLSRPGPRWETVTVSAGNATMADGLSTAVAAAPRNEAPRLLSAGGAKEAVLIAPGGALTHWQRAGG